MIKYAIQECEQINFSKTTKTIHISLHISRYFVKNACEQSTKTAKIKASISLQPSFQPIK